MHVCMQAAGNPPNKLLLVEGLPPTASAQMLELLFKQYLGLIEVRMVEAKPGLAFVEYDVEPSATQAMTGLQGFPISQGFNLRISYAK
jgi:RNA recognition motif-containing protein